MKKTDLAPILCQDFTPATNCGVMKVNDPHWKNIVFVVPPPPPTKINQKLPFKKISQAIKVLSLLPSYKEMSELDKLINYLFVRREVVQSSRLEGTWSTIDHVLTPGEIAEVNAGKDEHQAMRSYAKILEQFVEEAFKKKEKIFTPSLVCKIHKAIVENDPNSQGVPGKIRTPGEPGSIVVIGGLNRKEESLYNPAPPSEVKRCLKDVMDWFANEKINQLGDAGMGLTLPVRLAIGHAHFEAVHPFTDGNGRAGRSLWSLQMVCAGHMPLYLSGYVEVKKTEYSQALQEAQKKLNYAPLIEFVCDAIIESDLEVKKSKEVISSLEEVWKRRGKFRAKSAAERSLKVLLNSPIITSSILQKELQISGPASTNAINQLVEKGIIVHRKFENRKPVYAAEELIQILARPFGSDIDLALEKAQKLLE
jgi:Fic family protein